MSVVCNIRWLSKEPLAYMPRLCKTGVCVCVCVGGCVCVCVCRGGVCVCVWDLADIINHGYKVRSCKISLFLALLFLICCGSI